MVSYGSTDTVQRDSRQATGGSGGGDGTEQTSLLYRHGHSHATPSATPAATPPLAPAQPTTPTPSSSCSSSSTLTPRGANSSASILPKFPFFSALQPIDSNNIDSASDLVLVPDTKPASFHSYLAETLQAPYTTPFLLTITFSTAILDSMTYNRFATFASNQTGNTVFLALAAVHAGQRKLKLTLTSFAGFVGSGLLFGQLGAYFSE